MPHSEKRAHRWHLYAFASAFSVLIVGIVGFVASERMSVLRAVLGETEQSLLPETPHSASLYPVRTETLAHQAQAALVSGKPEQALLLIERALEQGGDATLLRQLFDTALLLGDIEKAESVLGLLSFHGVPESVLDALRGMIHLRIGELDAARKLFALEILRSEQRFGLLLVSILEGNHEEAQEHIQILLTSTDPLVAHSARILQGAYDEFSLFEDGKPEHLHTLLARACGQIGQWPAAITLLDAVTKESTDYRDAHILLGYAHLMLGESETALAAFEKAHSIDPEKSETQYFLGRTHERLGNNIEAITFFSYALQNGFTPKKSAREHLASIALTRGAAEEAISQYHAILDEGEADVGTYRALITLLIEHRNDIEQALEWAKDAREELGDSSADVLDLLGWTALLSGDVDNAATFLNASVTQDPLSASAWYHKGQLEEQVGESRRALASYRRAYEESVGSDQDLAFKAAERHNGLLTKSPQ